MIVFCVFFDVVRLLRMKRQSAKPDPKSFFFLIYVRASENQRSKNEAWLHNVEARPDFIHENSGLLGFGGLNLNRRSPTAFFSIHFFFVFHPLVGLRRSWVNSPKPSSGDTKRPKPAPRISMHQKFHMSSPYIYDK